MRHKKNTLSCPVYFTIDDKPFSDYTGIYKILNGYNFCKLFYIQFDNNQKFSELIKADLFNNGYHFPVPEFKCYEFIDSKFKNVTGTAAPLNPLLALFTDKKRTLNNFKIENRKISQYKSLLQNFPEDDLTNLYYSRLIFDGYIGLGKYKGVPSDIDLITKNKNNYNFLEVKEKDLSKTEPRGFGIDIQRLKDCLNLANDSRINYFYIVRQIDDQESRKFLSWKYIDFKEFDMVAPKKTVEGGQGMNTVIGADNPTRIVPLASFKNLP